MSWELKLLFKQNTIPKTWHKAKYRKLGVPETALYDPGAKAILKV